MTNKATLVMNGFLKLTPTERQEVIVEINKFLANNAAQQNSMCESFSNRTAGVTVGPTAGSCPCCGR